MPILSREFHMSCKHLLPANKLFFFLQDIRSGSSLCAFLKINNSVMYDAHIK